MSPLQRYLSNRVFRISPMGGISYTHFSFALVLLSFLMALFAAAVAAAVVVALVVLAMRIVIASASPARSPFPFLLTCHTCSYQLLILLDPSLACSCACIYTFL